MATETKTEYMGWDERDFVQLADELRELTVTITLAEYRALIDEQARTEIEISELKSKLEESERQARNLGKIVLRDNGGIVEKIAEIAKFLVCDTTTENEDREEEQ